MDERGKVAPSLRNILLKGSLWLVGLRWSIKLSGMISTMILARLLTPDDFGVVAMATAVSGLVQMLLEFGVDAAIIQKAKVGPPQLNAAWSIRLIQALVAAALIALFVPLVTDFYGDPRVAPVLYVIAFSVAVLGFENIGVVAFLKELEFNKQFQYLLSHKLLTVVVTLGLAVAFRSYWALVIGLVFGTVIKVLLSYTMHPYRPRFSLQAGREIWSFSKWMLVVHVTGYLTWQIDRFIIGGLESARKVGFYAMGGTIAELPSAEVVAPLSKSLAPGFAMLKGEPQRLDAAFLKALSATAMIGVPAALGMSAVASELVPIMLGDQWHEAIVFVELLAIYAGFRTLFSTSWALAIMTNLVKPLAILSTGRAILFISLIYPAYSWNGLVGIAYAKIFVSMVNIVLVLILIGRKRNIAAPVFIQKLWRPVASGCLMFVVLNWIGENLHGALLWRALLEVAAGASLYVLTIAALWYLSGKPRGVEADIIALLKARLQGIVSKRIGRTTRTK